MVRTTGGWCPICLPSIVIPRYPKYVIIYLAMWSPLRAKGDVICCPPKVVGHARFLPRSGWSV